MKKFYTLAAAACVALGMNAQLNIVGGGSVDGTSLAWTPDAPVVIEAGANGYEFTYTGAQGFKMSTASGTWDDFNAGALFANIENTEFTVGTPVDFALEINGEPNIMPAWEGDWKFVVKSDFSAMTVTALTAKPEGALAIYIRGGMNNWGNDGIDTIEAWKFSSEDGVTYRFIAQGETMIPAATEFKIADANWAAVNYGAGGEIYPSEDGDEWNYNANNTTLGEDFEGTIEFDLLPNKAPIMVKWYADEFGGVDSVIFDENAPKVYYNLQGVEVENPSNGLFIVKQGSKVAKQVIR